MIGKKIKSILISTLLFSSIINQGMFLNFVKANNVNDSSITTVKSSTQKDDEIIQNFISGYLENRYFTEKQKNDINTFIFFFNNCIDLSNDKKEIINPFIKFVEDKSKSTQFNINLLHGYYEMFSESYNLSNWGFKGEIIRWVSNERYYSWYIDQGDTGRFGFENCAPTSAAMAIKWANPYFNRTVEEAREKCKPYGGWWNTENQINYMDEYKVYNHILYIFDLDKQLKEIIDKGNIAILLLNPMYLSYNFSDKNHTGRFYSDSTGHSVLVKGYVETSTNVYFEIYDPYSMNRKYSNGLIKGQNRYFESKELYEAVSNYWNYLIFVSEKPELYKCYSDIPGTLH